MAEIAKSGRPSISTVLPDAADRITGLYAGEAIAAGDACYIASTGLVMRSNGSAIGLAAKVHGWAPDNYALGDAVTIYEGINFNYGAGLTPGTGYYVSGTVVGGIADVASTGGTGIVAIAVDATRIRVRQSVY